MNDNDKNESDTDVSSNSSWTILDDNKGQNVSQKSSDPEVVSCDLDLSLLYANQDDEEAEILETLERPSNVNNEARNSNCNFLDTIEISDSDDKGNSKNELNRHGCLTFDEYVKEQELSQDYDFVKYEIKRKRCEKPSQRRKCKADCLGTLTIISTVMAVAGVSFLCLLAPYNYALTGSEIERLKSQCNNTEVSRRNVPMTMCPLLCGKNGNLELTDPDDLISTVLGKNTTSKHISRSIKRNKTLKSLNTLNLVNNEECSARCPLKDYFNDKPSPYNARSNLSTAPSKSNSSETSAKKAFGPELPSTVDSEVPDTPNVADQNQTDDPNAENAETGFTLSHCKLVCNVVQDIVLLRMLRNVGEERRRLARSKKSTKQTIKALRQKKEDMMKGKRPWDIPSYDNIAGKLADTLKHDKITARDINSTHKASSERTQRKDILADPSCSEENSSKESIPKSKCESRSLREDLEKYNKKRDDYLDKLKRAHQDRMEQIKVARERRQESILSLMNERKRYIEKVKEAACSLHSRVSLANSSDISNRLQKIRADHNLSARPHRCNEGFKLSNLNNDIKRLEYKRYLGNEKDNANSAVYYQILSEYVASQKKHLERQSSYWSKREEFLAARIQFLKEATAAVKEIVNNSRSKTCSPSGSIENILNKAVVVFNSDVAIKDLKNQLSSGNSKSRFNIFVAHPSKSMVKKSSLKILAQNTESRKSTAKKHEEKYLHKYKIEGALVPMGKCANIQSGEYYNHLFGKLGQQIRKKDITICYYNRTKKRKRQKDISKHDPRKKIKQSILAV